MDDRGVVASVIIPTKNGERYLRALLEVLSRQTLFERSEVIVIDSGSTDASLKVISEFAYVRLYQIRPEEFGHGRTRNYGARLARGGFLVFLPQDATPVGDDWLEKILQPFANPSVAGVYAKQVARPEANAMETFFLLDTYPSKPTTRSLAGGDEPSLASCFFSTVGGAIRASVWASLPFREDIIMSEDQAWASEVMRAGYSIVYEPAACVLHSHQYGVVDVFRRNFDSGYSIHQIYAGKTGIPLLRVLTRLTREVAFVIGAGKVTDWLRFLPYETARHMGFMLGLRADKLPVVLRKKCSSLAYFWERPSAGTLK